MKFRTFALGCGVVVCVVFAVLASGCTGNLAQSLAGDITVVADSAVQDPMTDVVTAYEATYKNVNVSISYGNSAEIVSAVISGTVDADDIILTNTDDIRKIVAAKPEYTETNLKYKVSVAAKDTAIAKSLVTFLKGGDGLAIFKAHGFTVE